MSGATYGLVVRYSKAPALEYLFLLKMADGYGGNGDDPRELVFTIDGLADGCHMDVTLVHLLLDSLIQHGELRITGEREIDFGPRVGRHAVVARFIAGEGKGVRHE